MKMRWTVSTGCSRVHQDLLVQLMTAQDGVKGCGLGEDGQSSVQPHSCALLLFAMYVPLSVTPLFSTAVTEVPDTVSVPLVQLQPAAAVGLH